MSNSAEAIVRSFCDAWERRDLDAILAALSEDVVYQNVPIPEMRGLAEARAFIEPIVRDTVAIDFEIRGLAVSHDLTTVMTERIDRLHYPAGVVEIPVMGTFVIRDQRIAHWREYSDLASTMQAFARVGVALAPQDG